MATARVNHRFNPLVQQLGVLPGNSKLHSTLAVVEAEGDTTQVRAGMGIDQGSRWTHLTST